MNPKNIRRAEKNLRACRSFRGHDFEVVTRYAKKVTTRARRAPFPIRLPQIQAAPGHRHRSPWLGVAINRQGLVEGDDVGENDVLAGNPRDGAGAHLVGANVKEHAVVDLEVVMQRWFQHEGSYNRRSQGSNSFSKQGGVNLFRCRQGLYGLEAFGILEIRRG